MNVSFSNKKLSTCGITAAIVCVLGILAGVFQFNTLFMLIATSLVMCFLTQRVGAGYSLLTALVSSALLFLLTWDKVYAVESAILFSSYPAVKYIIESKITSRTAEYIVKILYFALISIAFVIIAEFFFGGKSFWGEWYNGVITMVIVSVVLIVAQIVYDILLSYAIYLLNKKFNGSIFR